MRKLVGVLAALLFGAAAAMAQTAPIGVCISNVAQTISNGVIAPIPLAAITLCTKGSTATNCASSKATIYPDTTLSGTPLNNPFTADAGGNYYFCAAVGHYALLISASVGSYFVPDVTLSDDWSKGGLVSGTWQATQFIGPLTGNVTGNASTATALAATPTNCGSGGTQYAYGIQASGNALCGTFPSPVTLYYQTVGANGTGQTQRPTLNFSSRFVVSDSASPAETNVDFASVLTAGSCSFCSFSWDAYGRVTSASSGTIDPSISRFCGVSSFSGGTAGSSVSCAWVTSSSHCDGAWIGTPPGNQTFGINVFTGSVSTTGSANSSASVSVFCSVD